MNISVVLIVVIALAAGATIGFLLGRGQSADPRQRGELIALRVERDGLREQLDLLRADRDAMSREFQRLSVETIARQTQSVDATAKQRLDETKLLVEPLGKNLQALNDRLLQVEKDRSEGAADLRRQVSDVRMSNDNLQRETQALVTALRRPQVRGAWGETQLKRAVEIAGMVERVDFDTQVAAQTDDGGQRPDMRVNMADDKVLFIDAKTPLGNFIDAFATDNPDRRDQLLGDYVRNVVTHINQLSAKNYWKLDTGSPEMVILFLPSDALLQVALEQRPDLHEYAASHQIHLASPSILIPLLRAVQHGWRQAAFAESAQQVAALGRELYDRLSTMGGHLDKLGRSLSGAVDSYNKTVGSLEQRVFSTARKLRDLEITDKELPIPTQSDKATRVLTAPELVEDVD